VAIVPGSFFARAAELSLLVVNADGNRSNTMTLTVENGPLITRLSRGKIGAGVGVFELTVGGVAFKPGVVLLVNDTAVSTSYVSDASFTARIPAEMTSQPGVLTLQARNPDGGRSNTVKFKVVQ
jgi:IPT/TIG domain-containing protein